MREVLARLLKIGAAAFLLLLVVEAALMVRARARHAARASALASGTGNVRVLVYGDSVTIAERDGYPEILRERLGELSGAAVSVVDLARPNLRTDTAIEIFRESLRLHDPSVVLVMVGKSDRAEKLRDRRGTIFREVPLLTFQVLDAQWRGLLRRWRLLLIERQVDLAYAGIIDFRRLDDPALIRAFVVCPKRLGGSHPTCLDLGEAAVTRVPNDGPLALHLRETFERTETRGRGIHFFENLLTLNPAQDEYRYPLAQLYLAAGEKGKLAKLLESMRERGLKEFEKAKLLSGLHTLDMEPMVAASDFPSGAGTVTNFRELLRIAREERKPIAFLQYPSDNVANLARALETEGDATTLVFDTHAALLARARADGRDLRDYLQDDFEHLTSEGHRAVGEALAPKIANLIFTKENQ